MLLSVLQEQAKAQLKAALLGVIATHSTDEGGPHSVQASITFHDFDETAEGDFTVVVGRQPLVGGSL